MRLERLAARLLAVLLLLGAAAAARADAWEGFFAPFLGDLRGELAEAPQLGSHAGALLEQRTELLVATRDRRRIAPDLLREIDEPALETLHGFGHGAP